MENHEHFDGEDAIAYGYQQRFLAEWRENGPSRVTTFDYLTHNRSTRDFATRVEAEAFADLRGDTEMTEVAPIR